MKLGKVIGRVVSTTKVDSFEGLKLILVQPVDEKLNHTGDAIVMMDTLSADIGQIISYETSKEGSMVLELTMNPCDAAVVGIVDEINLEDKQ